ncbi:MAG TPA: glycoside hydrolase family protein [Tichowtungia sp.]|nr:glycoside hydrolase family protein [Tichowtungia sp.]
MKPDIFTKLIILTALLTGCIHRVEDSTDTLNLAEMIQPVSEENILYQPDFYNWGSSIIKGEDGKYHIFYAQMTKELGFYSWMTDGLISRAVSDNPAGPYRYVETVLKGRGQPHWDAHTAHNPRIKKFGDKYYLYYISTNPNGNRLDERQMNLARRLYSTEGLTDEEKAALKKESAGLRKQFQMNQRIGVAVADQISGPWKRLDHPIVEPGGPISLMTCNPAVTERPDGGYLMFVRGIQPNIEKFTRSAAIALADSPVGPWAIQKKAAVADLNSEDPAVWYDKQRRRYYAIYHAFGYMGLITSTDGVDWKPAKHYKVLEKTIYKSDGTPLKAARLERPYIYLEDGEPKVMTVAVREKSGESYSVFIPLKKTE